MFLRIQGWYAHILTNKIARYWIKEWVEPVVVAFLLAMLIRYFFVQAFKIPSGSMRDTLLEGDRILVSKCAYWKNDPKLGDVMVFRFPDDRKRDFIKRVIGTPGDRVRIAEGNVYVNDVLVEEPSIIRQIYYYTRFEWPYGQENQEILVPEGHYFMLGDNSGHSHDSRAWGFVPRKDVKGKAFFVFWPLNRWKVIK